MTGAPVVYGGGGGGSISHLSTGVVGLGGLGGGGNGGALGWELYDARDVGRRLGWRVWQHSRAHPTTASGYGAGGPGRSSSGFGTPAPGTTRIGGGGYDGFGGSLAVSPGGDGVVIVRYRIP